jgi:cytochrome c peroxidase
MVRVAFIITGTALLLLLPKLFAAECNMGKQLPRERAVMSCADYVSDDDKAACLEGQRLFYDPTLSIDGKASCSSCHVKDRQFTDNRRRPYLRGEEIPLSRTISLRDISRRSAPYFWNGRAQSLNGAIYWPLYQAREIGADPKHLLQFGGGQRVSKVLGTYINTLNSAQAPYDDYAKGNCLALSPGALEGLAAFQADDCGSCHKGSEFAGDEVQPYTYENLPEAYFIIEEARYGQDWELHSSPKGRSVTLEAKAPSLRNLAHSGPFGQFGQHDNLESFLAEHIQKVSHRSKRNSVQQKKLIQFLREGLTSPAQ